MNDSKLDKVGTFIAVITSAIVAESKCHNMPAQNDNEVLQRNQAIEEHAGYISDKCAHVDNDPALYPLDHIQLMKVSLAELFNEIRKEITDEVRSAIKLELRTELMIELDSIREEIANKASKTSSFVSNTALPNIVSDTQSNNTAINIDRVPTINRITPLRTNNHVDPLQNNELFQRVCKNIDRSQRGEAMYTPEELIKARGNRFDDDNRDEFIKRANEAKYDYDSEESSGEDERFEKMMREKMSQY